MFLFIAHIFAMLVDCCIAPVATSRGYTCSVVVIWVLGQSLPRMQEVFEELRCNGAAIHAGTRKSEIMAIKFDIRLNLFHLLDVGFPRGIMSVCTQLRQSCKVLKYRDETQ
jgi:hypothetical protein